MAMQDGIWAFGMGANLPIGVVDRTPPAITLDTEGEKYLSPNFDGVKDGLKNINIPFVVNERIVRGLDYYLRTNPSAREHLSDLHRCEPYVYAQMIAGRDAPTFGEAKNSWLTGAAAWNYVGPRRRRRWRA
jgi:hypothetical protein